MKKNISIVILNLFIFLLFISSCEKEDAVALNISIKTLPEKVEYYIGEELDLNGLVIEMIMDDETINEIPFPEFDDNNLKCYPRNGSTIKPDSKVIEIKSTLFDKMDSFNISLHILIDIDNNTYSIVKIGNQFWTGENLKTTKYNDGDNIPLVTNNEIWDNLITPGYCWYHNDKTKYKDTYGALYNWHVVNTKKIAPQGWHVPTNDEWNELINFLTSVSNSGLEGLHLKSFDIWEVGNGFDSYYFGALPGGYRIPNGSEDGFNESIGKSGHWWSSTEHFSLTDAQYLSLYDFSTGAIMYHLNKKNGISIRLIKD